MNVHDNTVLITGGATGIGFALAEALVNQGNQVLACSRSKKKLDAAKERLPALTTLICDVSQSAERESLAGYCHRDFPGLNILINNAGIQRFFDLAHNPLSLVEGQSEIVINLEAPVELSALMLPLLLEQRKAAIINVSSGLGFVPIASMPVYCATKAGLHIFTASLRYQLRDTSVQVFELVPPAVETELGKEEGLEEPSYPGMPPAEVASAMLDALSKDTCEVFVGEAKKLYEESKADFDRAFADLNRW
jgi:uncharacterized oxidoreductase